MDAIARPSVQDLQGKSADLSFAIMTAGNGSTALMVSPIDLAPLLAIEPVVMGEMKPVLAGAIEAAGAQLSSRSCRDRPATPTDLRSTERGMPRAGDSCDTKDCDYGGYVARFGV